MKTFLLSSLATILLISGVPAQQIAAPNMQSDPQRLMIGAWRLAPAGVYVEETDGTRSYPFGRTGTGRFVVTADGFAAGFIQFAHRSPGATGTSPRQCTTKEAAEAFKKEP